MKKRILIASHGLDIGGAESSLIGYLHALAEMDGVETDLFLYRHGGELMDHIPPSVNLLPPKAPYACLATPIKSVMTGGHFLIAAGRAYGKRKAKKYITKHGIKGSSSVGLEYSHKYTKAFMPRMTDKEYDLAVSFLTPHYFVTEKVTAKKKLAFIHTDYSKVSVDVESELEMWGAYDYIAAVSEGVKDSFLGLFPGLKDKVLVIENINPVELISVRANESAPMEVMEGETKILSIGRFCEAKNFESIPHKMKLLKEKGLAAKWYIIGFGDNSLIKKAIKETGTEKYVIILGKRTNPYPYIKGCDIYAQPSRYEGKSVTVLEAQILLKPVIIANYATAGAQLKDGYDGIIAPMDDEGFTAVLADLIKDKEKQGRLIEACKNSDYSNKDMARKLVDLI